MNESEKIGVLVVDDDAITLQFFKAAFREMRVACVVVEGGASALAAIRNQTFDLLLIDRNLPDTSGPALLKALRDAGTAAPAIATSAEVDAHVRSAMIDAGFNDVIAKPIAMQKLRDVIAAYVTLTNDDATPLLDDGAALGSLGGSVDSLAALRTLLANELDDVRRTYLDAKTIDAGELSAKLHRLRASCGFCGASALAEAAKTLQGSLQDHTHDHRHDVSTFLELCAATAKRLREGSTAHR